MGPRSHAGRLEVARRLGIGTLLALLAVQSASAVLPTYSTREVLLLTGGPQPQETVTADFNCDGRMDVLWVQMAFQTALTYPVRIFLSDGLGSYVDGTAQVITGTVPQVQHPREMVLSDFNGDGRADVFIADTGMDRAPFPGYQNSLLLSTPDCRLMNGTSGLPQQNADTHSAAAADIDGDDDVDLFLGNYWNGQQPQLTPQILLNDGSAHFSIASAALPVEMANLSTHGVLSAEFVDLDADGDADLVTGGDQQSPSRALVNDGFGRFTFLPGAFPAKPFAPTAQILDLKAIELNGDGKQDLIIAATKFDPYYQGRLLQVLINNGNGTFSDDTAQRMPQATNNNTWFKFIRIVDVDGDGHLDVVGTVPYQTSVNGGGDHVFWINNGTGVFTAAQLFQSMNGLDGTFAFVDVNGNGRRDFLSIGEVQTSRVRQTSTALTPGVPQGVRATRMLSDRVRIAWPYVWGATQYEVWRSPSAGGAGSLLGTTAAQTFDDMTATGSTAYYSVRALNSAGTSGASAVVPGVVAVFTAPSVTVHPTDRAALIGEDIQLTAGATGTPAPAYQWQLSTDGGLSWQNLSNGATYQGVTTSALTIVDAPAALNAVRYRCVATNSVGSASTNSATLAITAYLPFTDNTLMPGSTVIRAAHVTELRSRINAVRARYGLAAFTYSVAVTVGTPVRAADVVEMRSALSQAYLATGLPAPVYDGGPAPGTPIRAAHLMQLRAALAAIEPLPVSYFDFSANFAAAGKGVTFLGTDGPLANGAVVEPGQITAGGVTRSGTFVHPPWQGQVGGETFLQYSVPVPAGGVLQFSVGVADNANCTDGVTFRLTAGGTELWRAHVLRTGFKDVVVRLDAYSGTTTALRFISHPGPGANPNCDWSLWSRLALGATP